MKLNKCFTDTFNPTMKQAGFSKIGLLYYRIHGNMLQGVFCDPINPFNIYFASFPYWMYDEVCIIRDPNIKRGSWTARGGVVFGFYYNPKLPEQNETYMQTILDVVTHTVLVYLDSMKTEQDFFLKCVNGSSELDCEYDYHRSCDDEIKILAHPGMRNGILLHQKYLGNLPMPVETYLEKYLENLLSKKLRICNTDEEIAKATDSVKQERERYLSILEKTSRSEFIERYNTMCVKMKKELEEGLKITSI